jgi:AcrR family transcriptional regulator
MKNKKPVLNIKNKDLTKKKLVWAVGEIIKTDGFSALKISTIAKVANVDRKLVYRYFGSLDRLIESYIIENDYWMIFADKLKQSVSDKTYENHQSLIADILKNQFQFFLREKNMQRLILWELSTESALMRSIHNTREANSQSFFEVTDAQFPGSKVNFRAIAALLVGGIYYTILHTVYNCGTVADVDLNTVDGQNEIMQAIEQIVNWAFLEAAK